MAFSTCKLLFCDKQALTFYPHSQIKTKCSSKISAKWIKPTTTIPKAKVWFDSTREEKKLEYR